MALATRCPYCRTSFRVTHDQLKLRGGLVRCGACKEIFNGVENLLSPPSGAQATESAMPGLASGLSRQALPEQTDTPQSEQDASPPGNEVENGLPVQDSVPTAPVPEQPDALPPTTPQQDIDPLTRMTLMDMRPWTQDEDDAADQDAGTGAPGTGDGLNTDAQAWAHGGQAETDADAPPQGDEPGTDPDASDADSKAQPEPDEIDRALGELQQKPWRGTTDTDDDAEETDAIDALDNEEPEFVRQARLQEARRRKTRLIFGFGSGVLLVLALLQTTLLMRTEIAARWPASLAVINDLCSVFGCKTGLPQRIEYVTIESHELQALPDSDNAFVLSTLLRNRSKTAQAWPHLELTLNDAGQQPVARRVLTPADYLPASTRARGMPPTSEKPVRVSFSLSQLKASGYQLYVFYP